MTNEERKAALEVIIYAADEPATIDQLVTALGDEKLAVQPSLDKLLPRRAGEARRTKTRGVNTGAFLKPPPHKPPLPKAGRKKVSGPPILYRTSKEFLMRFGLSD